MRNTKCLSQLKQMLPRKYFYSSAPSKMLCACVSGRAYTDSCNQLSSKFTQTSDSILSVIHEQKRRHHHSHLLSQGQHHRSRAKTRLFGKAIFSTPLSLLSSKLTTVSLGLQNLKLISKIVSKRCYSGEDPRDFEIGSDLLRQKMTSSSDDDDGMFLVDVREPGEIELFGSIEGAKNIPLSELESAFRLSEDMFLKKYGYEKFPDDGENLVFYCQVGIRSLHATMFARNLGYDSARSLVGGFLAWKESETQENR